MTNANQKSLRGSRLSEDWVPCAALINYAADLGVEGGVLARIVDDFRDYWISIPGQRGLKLNWDATFRTWLRREADKRSGGYRGPGGNGGGGSRPRRESLIDIAADLAGPSLGLRSR